MSKQLIGNLYSSNAPVTSVNTKQGEVVLSPSDIGAASSAGLSNALGIATEAIPGTYGIKRIQRITAANYALLQTPRDPEILYAIVG